MKSFFKKLSLVLAAAMVITMLPLQSAKAATTTVGIGTRSGNKVTTGTSFTMEVGETQQWGFSGVAPYNQTAIATKKFVSDNTAVVTVAADKLTAVAAGIANITFTCNNGTTDFIGKATVTVKAAGTAVTTNGTVKQDTYQSVVVTFATEDAAKAAVEKIKVERVKASTKGNFYLNVNTTQKQDKNTVKISGLSDQVTYRFTIPGQAKPEVLEMSVGVATDLILEYPTVYLGTGMDIVGNNVKNPTVTPIVKIVDANGIVTNEPVKNVKYTTDKTKNQYATFTAGSGKIKFSSINGQCYVKATYTFKDAAGQSHTLTDDLTVSPVAYVAPSLQGFVEQICLTNKTGKDVTYPTDYSFSGKLAVGEKKAIAYYFETPDGVKYAGKNVKDTVIYDSIKELNDKDYILYFVKDNPNATAVSLYNFGTKTEVRGWNEGTERICLYKQVGTSANTLTDTLVGVIDITVQPEPYVFDMQLSDNSAEGFTNGITTTTELTYALIDQYDNAIDGVLSAKGTDGSSVANFVTITPGDKTGEGKIKVDFAALGVTTEAKDVVISVRGSEYTETISCSAEAIKTDSTDLGYDLIVDSLDVKNKNFINVTAINALGVNFKVAETRDGNRLKYVDFIVTSDDIDETVPTAAAGTLVLVISNADDQIVKASATQNIVTQGNAACINAASSTGFTFDVFPTLANALTSIIGEELKVGSFTANLYKVTGANKGNFDLQSSVEYSVSNSMELIQNIDTTYKLKAEDNKVKRTGTATADLTWTSTDEAAYTVTSAEQYKALMQTIVGQLYGWYDFNSDGKATTDEVNAIKVLFPGFSVTDCKYVAGAENNEVFVKTITIKYPVRKDNNNLGNTAENGAPSLGSYAEQTITINRKFNH